MKLKIISLLFIVFLVVDSEAQDLSYDYTFTYIPSDAIPLSELYSIKYEVNVYKYKDEYIRISKRFKSKDYWDLVGAYTDYTITGVNELVLENDNSTVMITERGDVCLIVDREGMIAFFAYKPSRDKVDKIISFYKSYF